MNSPINSKFYRQFILLFLFGLTTYLAINSANAYLVSKMGKELYSDYSITILVLFFLCSFFFIGTTAMLIEYIPLLIQERKRQLIKWNSIVIIKSTIVISLLLLFSYIIGIFIDKTGFCISTTCYKYTHIAKDLFYMLPVAMIIMWNSSFLNAEKKSFLSQIIGNNTITYLIAIALFIFSFFNQAINHLYLFYIIITTFFLLLLIQAICLFFVFIKTNKVSIKKIINTKISKKQSKIYLSDGLSLMVNKVIVSLPSIVCLLMLEWFDPNEISLSYFIIISFISNIGAIIPNAISIQMAPFLSGINDPQKLHSLQTINNIRVRYSVIWLFVVIALILTFKKFIFIMYSINFKYALLSIIVLTTFNCFFSIILLYEKVCFYNNMNKRLYKVTVSQIIVALISSYFLIKQYSFLGALYSLIISELFAAISCWFIVKKQKIKIKAFGLY